MRGGRNTGDRCASAGGDGACQNAGAHGSHQMQSGAYTWESREIHSSSRCRCIGRVLRELDDYRALALNTSRSRTVHRIGRSAETELPCRLTAHTTAMQWGTTLLPDGNSQFMIDPEIGRAHV